MPKIMTWNHPQFDLIGTNSNYFLLFDETPDITAIPLPLECGETLKPGDDFHMAGTGGAAFNPGFQLTEGSLTYLGQTLLDIPGISETVTMLLFDWTNGCGARPLPDIAAHGGRKIAYVAFSLINETEWMFTSSSCSARVVITNELRRGPARAATATPYQCGLL